MATATITQAETQIRGLVDNYIKAVRARDLDGIVRDYAPDTVFFDAIPPLKLSGAAAYRKNWQDCFAMMDGPVGFDVTQLEVHASEDVAYAHMINHLSGTVKPEGKMKDNRMDFWFRATIGFRKIGSAWKVTHEHASVPFNPENNTAATDLKP
jgi:ketosteroid isomerase-like protein